MLTKKRKRFCEEYIKDLNGSAAAIHAGYNLKRSRITASELLLKPEVKEYLDQLQAKVAKRNEITIDELIQDLAEMKNIDVADLYDEDGLLIDISRLPTSFTRCIQEVIETKSGLKIKFYSKLDAIEKLAKHLGFYEKDNRQSKAEMNLNITVDSQEMKDELTQLINGKVGSDTDIPEE